MKALQVAGKTEQQIALETTQMRLAALQPVLAQYTDHYNKLVAQAQTYKQRVESIEQSRIAFNESLEKTLFGIRIAGLSAFDQYVAKVQETEKLIAKAREEGAKGNIQAAEKYTQEAIALSGTLQKAVREDGTVIVSEFEAQQKQIRPDQESRRGSERHLRRAGRCGQDRCRRDEGADRRRTAEDQRSARRGRRA